ncbi:glutathione S-transferase D7 [Agrilus planipennis]|uniref:Glutathione S-transferase D7 n=1 Tax=Agrilus planipennis TaxID=224129 RepID=A0A1W4X757_AGRPL|nr:glutathione S-transferase D7 [Agrilus planipennis]
MDGIDLYYFPPSPPCRAVLLFLRVLGLTVNLKSLNIVNGDQMKPEFLKLNPQHTIPTLVDHDYVLWESRAILKYLEDQYDKEHKYIPNDPKLAAKVDQLLYFDIGTLYQSLMNYYVPVLLHGEKPNDEQADKVKEALKLLNTLLENSQWVAGPQMTIADFSIIATVSTADAVGFNIKDFPRVSEWYEKMKKTLQPYGYEEVNQKGADLFTQLFHSKIKNKQ